MASVAAEGTAYLGAAVASLAPVAGTAGDVELEGAHGVVVAEEKVVPDSHHHPKWLRELEGLVSTLVAYCCSSWESSVHFGIVFHRHPS